MTITNTFTMQDSIDIEKKDSDIVDTISSNQNIPTGLDSNVRLSDLIDFHIRHIDTVRPTLIEENTTMEDDFPDIDITSDKIESIWEDKKAIPYFRSYYVKDINRNMEKLIGNMDADNEIALYVENIMQAIREMRDLIPYDPILDFLISFYNALSHNNYWSEYSKDQYQSAYDLVKKICKRGTKQKDINDAIIKLSTIGFNISSLSIEPS